MESYFRITDVNEAIYDTIEDSDRLQCLIMDISPEADLNKIFRPLENSRTSEMLLGKERQGCVILPVMLPGLEYMQSNWNRVSM